jgi:hypothetical protein
MRRQHTFLMSFWRPKTVNRNERTTPETIKLQDRRPQERDGEMDDKAKIEEFMANLDRACEECGGNYNRHYADCSRFKSSSGYYGVFYPGASHPIAAFVMEQEAERYGKQHDSEEEKHEIKRVLIWMERPNE